MTKLFNEYYTKSFNLPGRFTAMNGAIQYFELTTKASLTADAPADPENPTLEEAKAIAEAQANYLRVLEVMRSRGAQPVITSVEGTKLGFTLEQTWVYGKSMAEGSTGQVSDHYEDGKADEESKFNGLETETKDVFKDMFEGVKALEAKGDKIEEIYVEDKEGENSELVDTTGDFIEIKVTAGSLNANK